MTPETFKSLETILLNIALVVLFVVIFFAVHDVLKKNKVPKIGQYIVYGVLGLGCFGFVMKGIIELYWVSQGI